MKFLSFIGSSIFQILSFIFVLSYLLGVLNIHFSDKNEFCLMTYMFEYPQFVRVTVPENKIYPHYGLYAYSEGRFTEKARKMWFDGVPVLFLPGNSGSHMQARSLASVALRKALAGVHEFHFDYFTIGYNEELSGLYGGVLQSQTNFAAACITRILSLYKSNKYTKSVPSSVIIIGHSMGGVIAKRLLTYPLTINTTSIAITLAAPLEAPVVNFDSSINDYYMYMNMEWQQAINSSEESQKKILLSIGNGPRDILMPSGLTSSRYSYINALTTAIPGVWVSPDHVGIVWCKQLVMTINKYLFSIVDRLNNQVSENKQLLTAKAKQYFLTNRSMTLSPEIFRPNVNMIRDAFWYEDNRRIYQVSRPEINKPTYLMIRLINYPQNRFAAVETVNVTDKDWIFGCNAQFTYNTYRYCKRATSLTELSRWTGAAVDFGKRKLATIHLHSIKELHPDWTHVIIKVSPTRKPVILNVDINDHASRQITILLPSVLSFSNTIVKQETEPNSLYYELILPDFHTVYQGYLLYVEPTVNCKASQYHVSAEAHVPWASNNEYYHYFTHLKHSPMKLRLYKNNPNVTYGLDATEFVKVTLLLDPQCTFTISISSSWYLRLAQIARNYTPVLIPYVAAVVMLAARSNILHLKEHGTCLTVHGALMSQGVKPYYVLVCARVVLLVVTSIPLLTFLLENASWRNNELQHFARSLLVVPAYMTALGIVHIVAAAVLAVMVFSSQLAHRLLFRIMWRSSSNIAEKVASSLQKVPMLVSVAITSSVPLSCGAASLVAGAAFYAFMLSKMYEEYLEDYVYKLMAKVASKMCRLFTNKNRTVSEVSLVTKDEEVTSDIKAIENKEENKNKDEIGENSKQSDIRNESEALVATKDDQIVSKDRTQKCEDRSRRKSQDVDEELNNINFHMMMFFLWMCVTLVNVPALLTWAKNFKYNMVLKPDTSYHIGLVMSACSACLWQMNGPRRNLKHYDVVASLLFITAVCILVFGLFSLTVVSYGVTFMYVVIILQQLCDQEEKRTNAQVDDSSDSNNDSNKSSETNKSEDVSNDKEKESGDSRKANPQGTSDSISSEPSSSNTSKPESAPENTINASEDCLCSENRIYTVFKNLREKFSFTEE